MTLVNTSITSSGVKLVSWVQTSPSTGTSITSSGVKLVSWVQISPSTGTSITSSGVKLVSCKLCKLENNVVYLPNQYNFMSSILLH